MHKVVFVFSGDTAADIFTIGRKVAESSVDAFFYLFTGAQTGSFKFASSGYGLILQFKDPNHPGVALTYQINMTWFAQPFRNEFSPSLLGDGNELFLQGFPVNVREMNIIEFHAPDFLELFFYPAAAHQGILQDFSHILAAIFPMGIK